MLHRFHSEGGMCAFALSFSQRPKNCKSALNESVRYKREESVPEISLVPNVVVDESMWFSASVERLGYLVVNINWT